MVHDTSFPTEILPSLLFRFNPRFASLSSNLCSLCIIHRSRRYHSAYTGVATGTWTGLRSMFLAYNSLHTHTSSLHTYIHLIPHPVPGI